MSLSKSISENQLLLGIGGLSLVIYLTKKYWAGGVCKSQAKLHGKTVIITGSNTGIGEYFVRFKRRLLFVLKILWLFVYYFRQRNCQRFGTKGSKSYFGMQKYGKGK